MKVHSGPTPSVKSISDVVSACRKVVDSFDCWEVQGDGLDNGFMPFLLAAVELHHSISQLPVYDDGRLGAVIGWPFEFPGAVRGIALNFRSMVSTLGIDSYFKDDGSSNGMIASKGVYIIRDGKRSTDGLILLSKSLPPGLVETQVRKIDKASRLLAKWVMQAAAVHSGGTEIMAGKSQVAADEEIVGYLDIVLDPKRRTIRRVGVDHPAITMTGGQWEILEPVVSAKGATIAYEMLADGGSYPKAPDTVRSTVSCVRARLKPLGLTLKADRSMGYSLRVI